MSRIVVVDTVEHASLLYRSPARWFSFLLASALSCLILFVPTLLFGGEGELNHNQLMLIMWGVAAGFVHGVGFVPRNALLQILLGPVVAWLLMLATLVRLFI